MIKFLDLQKQYEDLKSEIDPAIQSVLARAAFIQGGESRTFEEAFARYQEAGFCIGVGNGTDALEIILEALELPRGSEVIVPANSFIASAEAVTRTGHQVVFADCNSENYTLSPEDVRRRITSKTKAVIAVHMYGHPCDMDALLELTRPLGIKLIEDCAQAHGSRYKGRRLGAIGDAGAFSFYPGKTLGAYGDGGAIVCNDEKFAQYCRMIANHGRTEKYNHRFQGRNSRLDEIQAAVLNIKLRHLDSWIVQRSRVAKLYHERLQGLTSLVLPKEESWAEQVHHLFVVRSPLRNKLKSWLEQNDVQTGVHYPISLPKLEAFQSIREQYAQLWCFDRGDEYLSLPMGEHLTLAEVEKICTLVTEGVKRIRETAVEQPATANV